MDGQFSMHIPLLALETIDKGWTIIKDENQMATISMYAFCILILGLKELAINLQRCTAMEVMVKTLKCQQVRGIKSRQWNKFRRIALKWL